MTDNVKLIGVAHESDDADLYHPDLDYFFNQYDYDSGLKSVGLGGMMYAFDMDGNRHKGKITSETVKPQAGHTSIPNTDPWADPESLKAFARGRKVWRLLGKMSYAEQQLLRRHYEHTVTRSELLGYGHKPDDERDVIFAHRFFRLLVDLEAGTV